MRSTSTHRPMRVLAASLPLLLCAALTLVVPALSTSRGSGTATTPSVKAVSYADYGPLGSMTGSGIVPGGFQAVGWSFDPSAPHAPLTISAVLDGVQKMTSVANIPRPDVARVFPAAGGVHGFAFRMAVPEGQHSLCLWAGNIGAGANFRLGCVNAMFDYGPVAALETAAMSPGAVHVRGWAWDNDNPAAALPMIVTIDGVRYTPLANLPRPDVAAKLRGGVNHGFDLTVPVAQGAHRVCVAAHNIGYGGDTSLGCSTVVVNDSPTGGVDPIAPQGGKLHISGWALDPDVPTTPLSMQIIIDGKALPAVTANLYRAAVAARFGRTNGSHGFDLLLPLAEGQHTVQVVATNVGLGSNRVLVNRAITLDFSPRITVTRFTAAAIGVYVTGWAADPDTSAPVPVRIVIDNTLAQTVTANGAGTTNNGHWFTARVPSTSGVHRVCAYAVNIGYGTHNSPASCTTMTLVLPPLGRFDALTRAPGGLLLTGWAADPDAVHTTATIAVTLDGRPAGTVAADARRLDVYRSYPQFGAWHGLAATIPASDGEHTVCLTVTDIGGTSNRSLGCRLIIAVHPVVPSAPRAITAVAGFGGAVLSWQPPASDGGAPPSRYEIVSVPDHRLVYVSGTTLSMTFTGLRPKTTYRFAIRAINVAGNGAQSASAPTTTQATPPAQTSPAPVSTSRYIRNIRGSSPAELATMRAEGVADATANPSGHGYMILLDIGGQYGNGVLLSATTRFVTYTDLVRDIQAYVDGYASAQRPSAPAMIAIGTNNDINVSGSSGRDWADQVVDPIRAHAAAYTGITIAGANDIEPGFNAGYAATLAWLRGYLGGTSAPFVFNGSADGCAWTVTNRGCNNGWTMSGLYNLAAGVAPTRIINLPQIYNTTMAAQWKYISLTGVTASQPRISFGGPLTEWTACDQSGSCGSMTGRSAWASLWANLQSDARLRVGSLPYSTDLRVDS